MCIVRLSTTGNYEPTCSLGERGLGAPIKFLISNGIKDHKVRVRFPAARKRDKRQETRDMRYETRDMRQEIRDMNQDNVF